MNIVTGVVFIVIFYFVFGFIWRHTKTISFGGLGGFLDSWISQIVCAAVISWIATAFLVGGVLEAGSSLGNFLSDLNLFDIAIYQKRAVKAPCFSYGDETAQIILVIF